VQSEHGIGSKFTITLPVTLAIISALLVRVRDRWYALPITSVQEAIALDEKSVRTVEGREVLTLRGGTLPICRLERLFDIARLPRKEHSRSVRGGRPRSVTGASASWWTRWRGSKTS
jgi:chemotaxis protein histidine kinase CheA